MVASLGGGSAKPLEKSPAARVPHSPAQVSPARGRGRGSEAPGGGGGLPSCSCLSLLLGCWLVGFPRDAGQRERKTRGGPGQQWEPRAVGPSGGGRQARGRPAAGRGGGEGRRKERGGGEGGVNGTERNGMGETRVVVAGTTSLLYLLGGAGGRREVRLERLSDRRRRTWTRGGGVMGKTQRSRGANQPNRKKGNWATVCVRERRRGMAVLGLWGTTARPPRGLLSALAFLFLLLSLVSCGCVWSVVVVVSRGRPRDGRRPGGVRIQRLFHQTPTANGTASFLGTHRTHPAQLEPPTEEKTTEQPPLCICFSLISLFRPCRRAPLVPPLPGWLAAL